MRGVNIVNFDEEEFFKNVNSLREGKLITEKSSGKQPQYEMKRVGTMFIDSKQISELKSSNLKQKSISLQSLAKDSVNKSFLAAIKILRYLKSLTHFFSTVIEAYFPSSFES